MKISYIAIHHFGAPASTPLAKVGHMTEKQINELHRSRWPDFPSEFSGSFIGYNAIIYPNGELKQYRFVGEETAAQKNHNLDTLSICLAGNFTSGAEVPTFFQKAVLKNLIQKCLVGKADTALKVKPGVIFDLSLDRILPHRRFTGANTQCCGTGLTDNWVKDMLMEPLEKEKLLYMIRAELTRMIEIMKNMSKKKLGGKGESSECGGVRD